MHVGPKRTWLLVDLFALVVCVSGQAVISARKVLSAWQGQRQFSSLIQYMIQYIVVQLWRCSPWQYLPVLFQSLLTSSGLASVLGNFSQSCCRRRWGPVAFVILALFTTIATFVPAGGNAISRIWTRSSSTSVFYQTGNFCPCLFTMDWLFAVAVKRKSSCAQVFQQIESAPTRLLESVKSYRQQHQFSLLPTL